MRPFDSIKGKLIIFGLSISLIPITIITVTHYLIGREQLREHQIKVLSMIAGSEKIHLLALLESKKGRVSDFSSDGLIRDHLERINKGGVSKDRLSITLNTHLIKNKKPLDPDIISIILLDAKGIIVASTIKGLIGKDLSNTEVFLKGMSMPQGSAYVDLSEFNSLCDRNSIHVAVPLTSRRSAGGNRIGLIINCYDLNLLNKITLSLTGVSKTGEVYLVNRNKRMLSESRFIKDAVLKQKVDTEPVRKIVTSGQEMMGIYPDYRGVQVVGVSTYLPEYAWILIAEMDKSELFAPLKLLGIIAIILGSSSGVTVIIMGIFFAVSISRPINILKDATERFAMSKFRQRVSLVRNDEIGKLAESFNKMVDEIEEKNRSLTISEARFRGVFEQAAVGVALIDTATGRFLKCNKKYSDIAGYSMEEMHLLTFQEITHPEDIQADADNLKQLVDGIIRQYSLEKRYLRKDGSVVWINLNVSPTWEIGEIPSYHIAIAEDITERKRMEEHIKKQSYVLEHSPGSIIITDVDGNIEYVNSKFTRCYGYTLQEVVGKNPSLLKADNLRGEDYRELWQTIKSGKEWRGEFHNRKKNGEYCWQLTAISPLKNSQGKISNFVAAQESLDEVKQGEAELKKARDAALRANEAKSLFLSSMSHELRTPMNSILGFTQLLQSDTKEALSETQKENIGHISRSGNHLLNLINDVLDLSRIDAGKLMISPENVCIDSVVAEVIAIVESPHTQEARVKNITINDRTKQSGVFISADRTRLKQVITNLLSNAVKYNKTGGTVNISYEFLDDDMVRLVIEDSGPGIAKKSLKYLFEPFDRLGKETSNIEGTGIGLTITKRLVELMGGDIGVESVVGKGSKFYIDFKQVKPVAPEMSKVEDVTEKQFRYETSGKKTLLYIEDNPANLKLVQNILKRRPHIDMLNAMQAESGIALARTHHPDVILVDINLPDMDGYGALKILKSCDDTKGIPVIAISASAMTKDIERGMAAGFLDYITKPINVNQFLGVLDTVIAQHSRNQNNPSLSLPLQGGDERGI